VGNDVLVVDHAVGVRELLVREGRILVVADARRSKVDHLINVEPVPNKGHGSQLCHCCAETVASSLNFGGLMNAFQTVDFCDDLAADRVCSLLEPIMHLAVALGPHLVVRFVRVQVGDPVGD
jgi:hypothetical protein